MRSRHSGLTLCVLTVAALLCAAPGLAGDAKKWDTYGKDMTKGKMQPVSKVQTPTPEGKTVRAFGIVAEVCQAKGCWMNIEGGDVTMRVEFEDYGFFVPSNAAGKKVQLEGIVTERTLSEAEREHLQSESESGAPLPERMLVFVAKGVRIQDGGSIPADQQKRIGGKASDAEAEHGH
jgi:hypothetical protein